MKLIHHQENSADFEGKQPLELLKNGQLLSLSAQKPAGLILQKPFHAEFIGPGSAIGGMFDLECTTMHALGTAELTVPETLNERQDAFQKRVTNIETMQKICEADAPLDRATKLLEMLCRQFCIEEIQTVSNEVLAKLVGVLPSTIATAWQQLPLEENQNSAPSDHVYGESQLAVA
ncbi:MAG: hypothetical protein HC934_07280 [Acaryochloridaceae cyanobacterium SU_2_1]|nr:hypothetical protein [Acaryochloridaceae cyanobacterium SU_2_1]